jgi:PKD repeat protein
LKWIFILLFIVCNVAVSAQTVDFTTSTATGNYCNPQTVVFTQTCTGNPGGFIWNFGNGHTSVHGIDSTVYNTAGTYTVTLTALYADSAIVKTKTITINPTPTVNLTAMASSICAPGNIDFIASGNGAIASYEWDFGDGSTPQTTAGNMVSHFYSDYGSYTARVKATTGFGCSATFSYVVEVKRFTIEGTVSPKDGCLPVNAFFTVTTTIPPGDAAQSYVWDFGDGTPTVNGTNNSINHAYTTTDTSHAGVTITTTHGCVSHFDFSPVAYGIPPIDLYALTVSGRDTFCGSEYISFKGKSLTANSYYWEFGDDAHALVIDTVFTYKYTDTGAMHVVVTSMFNGCPGVKDSFDIYIKGMVAKFYEENTCANKNTFTFHNISPGTVTHYEWTFGDTPNIKDSVNAAPVHTFPLSGAFPVKIMLRDSVSGCSDSITRVIYTAQPEFTRSSSTVCKDSTITYYVTGSYPAGAVNYVFHTDGDIIDNQGDSVLHHIALNHGSFTDFVILNHGNPLICNDTLRLNTPTRVTGPVTNFTLAPDTVCLHVPVTFTNTTHPYFPSDNIVTWQWDFWDGNTDVVQHPVPHLFQYPGEYIVSVTATDVLGCALRQEHKVLVQPVPEITVYPRMDTICMNRDTATLSAYTIDPFEWLPATNISCNNCDTIKAWPAVTTVYIAQATNAGGCSSTDSSVIKVYGPINLVVSPANAAVCPKVPVQFNLNAVGITTWSPVAGLNDTAIANPVAISDTSVNYTIIVKDSAGCYADTVQANLHINPLPVVNAGPDRTLTYGTSFTLAPAYSAGSQSYLWTPPDDLDCNNCPQPTGIAVKRRNYTIEVTSDKGCKAKDDINIILACGNSNLYVPSAFTPDKIGPNNYFYPIARGYKSIKTFIIYNRMGNKVFERKDFEPNIATLGWDGTVKGNTYGNSTQAFVWYVEAVCEQGNIVTSKGTVLLIR